MWITLVIESVANGAGKCYNQKSNLFFQCLGMAKGLKTDKNLFPGLGQGQQNTGII